MDLITELNRANSRANRDRIARWVGTDTLRLTQLMKVYLRGDTRDAQLAAGVLFCCLEEHPGMLVPWLAKVVARMDEPDIHPAVRRVAVRALMEVDIPDNLKGRVVDSCFRYLADPDQPVAIRVFSMATLARIAENEPDLWHELRQTIETSLPYSSAAFTAHARKMFRSAARAGHRV